LGTKVQLFFETTKYLRVFLKNYISFYRFLPPPKNQYHTDLQAYTNINLFYLTTIFVDRGVNYRQFKELFSADWKNACRIDNQNERLFGRRSRYLG
jgi:hypothetical protein